jgi:hypothetical protein
VNNLIKGTTFAALILLIASGAPPCNQVTLAKDTVIRP